jgi:proline dehydrogenase
MDSERTRAKQLGYNDPINETINATHNNYNQAISTIVDAMAKKKRVAALVASHNENSVDWAWTNLQNSGFTTPEGVSTWLTNLLSKFQSQLTKIWRD